MKTFDVKVTTSRYHKKSVYKLEPIEAANEFDAADTAKAYVMKHRPEEQIVKVETSRSK